MIWNEWIDNLALRRVFYLEHDHFRDRKEELNYLANLQDPELEEQKRRPPYIPHPEIRDTIPNVALYSVLYKLPDYFYSTATTPTASMLDRQLSATVDFFDRCVPNQPGFSSSVAAVTILPDTKQVARAWKRWYSCASKLRRLRFIRRRIRQLEKNSQHPNNRYDQQMNSSIASSNSSQKKQPEPVEFQKGAVVDVHIEESTTPDESPPYGSETVSPRSISPRHMTMNTNALATVEELEDVSSEPTDLGEHAFRPRSSQCTWDIESTGTLVGTPESAMEVAAMRDFALCLDEVQESEIGMLSFESKDEPDDSENDIPDPVCIESSLLYSGTLEIPSPPSPSGIPFISESDASSPLDTINVLDPSRSYHHLASLDLRRSPETVGHAEEAKLDLFLSDEGMEQVRSHEFIRCSVYCSPVFILILF